MATIVYVSEVVYWKIICKECGYVEGNRYDLVSADFGEQWICPNCGCVQEVDEEDWIDE